VKYLWSTLVALPVVLGFMGFVWLVLKAPYFSAWVLMVLLLSYALGSKAYDRWYLPKMQTREQPLSQYEKTMRSIGRSFPNSGTGPR
jgi:hypothetical protein